MLARLLPKVVWSGLALLLWHTGWAGAAEPMKNWFNDPFVSLSADVPHCPEPMGPRSTERERLQQSHHRAERGATCYLRGQCSEPNYYAYDGEIARQVQQRLQESGVLAGTSVWLTVQGRVVYLEGCAPANAPATALAPSVARDVPMVMQVLWTVYPGQGKAPYPVYPPP